MPTRVDCPATPVPVVQASSRQAPTNSASAELLRDGRVVRAEADVEDVTVASAVASMAAYSGEAVECMPGPTAAVSERGVQRTSDARLWQRPGGRRLAQSISLSVVSQSPTRVAVCANFVHLRATTSSITNYDTFFWTKY